MHTRNLLLEIGTEELPPLSLRRMVHALEEEFVRLLHNAELGYSGMRSFATPRRLALLVCDLDAAQPDRDLVLKGPSVKAAFDREGRPTSAALGWARANQVDLSEVQRLKTEKGEILYLRTVRKGRGVAELIPGLFEQALAALPVPKLMHWGTHDFQFVRPVHSLCMMWGDELLKGMIYGISSSPELRGHRFLCDRPLRLTSAIDYPRLLYSEGHVIADIDERRQEIVRQITEIANAEGARPDLDEQLLEEVTALVEMPRAFLAHFEDSFLEVPAEALVHTMKADQKYFPLYDSQGQLLPKFIFISNINPADPGAIIAGNEKVIRPRLSDARFFFMTDRHHPLAYYAQYLERIVYQKHIGSVAFRSQITAKLAIHMAALTGADPDLVGRAAQLAKCDLATTLVTEFTDLQGVAGMYYARLDGEAEEVARAIREQYLPRFAGDELPKGAVAITLSLAEKLSNICCICGVNLLPKGDKDPYGLRRAAIGIIRIVLENRLSFNLAELAAYACSLLEGKLLREDTAEQVTTFILQRLKAYYKERQIGAEIFNAVYEVRHDNILDFDQRVRAVMRFKTLPAAADLASAYKRVANILGHAQELPAADIDPERLRLPEERSLLAALQALEPGVLALYQELKYEQALETLAELRKPIDDFFAKVLVNDPDPELRRNRIAMLDRIYQLFSATANISVLY